MLQLAAQILTASIPTVVPTGQVAFTASGTFNWTVPADVTSIAAVCISAGGAGSMDDFIRAGGGGSLAYRNAIPVTPGEVLAVETTPGSNGRACLRRGSTVLVGVKNTGFTTPPSDWLIVGTGFVGGTGGFGGLYEYVDCSGGGAGGYTSKGGDGGPYNFSGGKGSSLMGGGAGGLGGGASGPTGEAFGGGGAIYRNGAAYSSATGGVRIIHGPNRAFPNTNTGDMA